MTKSITASVERDEGGYFVEWFRDTDGGSGLGERPEVARWYGSLEDCRDMTMRMPPKDVKWRVLASRDQR